MILKQTNLNIRASQAEKAMLEQVAQAHETTPSEMMRQLIREAHAQLGKQENIMNSKQILAITDSLTESAENYSRGRTATRCALGAYDEICREREITADDLKKSWQAAYNWNADDSGSRAEAARNAYEQ